MSVTQKEIYSSVSITAPARLHFGFLSWNDDKKKRQFGSVGVTLDKPRLHLTAQLNKVFSSCGDENERIEKFYSLLDVPHGVQFNLERALASHQGLGSGTQLCLSVGALLCLLQNKKISPRHILARCGRGKRSGLGVAAFEGGGFILDGGLNPQHSHPPPLISRLPYPDEWRILLLCDHEQKSIFGQSETQAFDSLKAMPEAQSAQACRVTLLQILPALMEKDFSNFTQGIQFLQDLMAQYFAIHQGGAYLSPLVAKVLNKLRAQNMQGMGQSSWGPTGFILLPNEENAQKVKKEIATHTDKLTLIIAKGQNHGATLFTSSPDKKIVLRDGKLS